MGDSSSLLDSDFITDSFAGTGDFFSWKIQQPHPLKLAIDGDKISFRDEQICKNLIY